MSKTVMTRGKTLTALGTALIALTTLGACSSTGGGANTTALSQTNSTPPPPPPSNPNITVLSAGNPANGQAIDETFEVASSFLVVQENASGSLDTVSRSRSDFRDPSGTVFFDAETGSLTFNIQEGDVVINDVFGPILTTPIGDFSNLENDAIAVTVSTFPERFALPSSVVLPQGAQTLEDLRGNPEAVDALVADLQTITSSTDDDGAFAGVLGAISSTGSADDEGEPEEVQTTPLGSTLTASQAADILATFQAVASSLNGFDFITHNGLENGTVFQPLQLRENNPGIETSYVQLGVWQNTQTIGGADEAAFGASVFGQLTPASEVPTVGSATYDTTIGGFINRQGNLDFLTGSVTIDANFATRMVDLGILSVIQTSDANGEPLFTDFVELQGEGLLTGGNRFDGDLRGTQDQSIRGEIAGAFFGPIAQEVGGTLRFGNDDFEAAGAFVGTQATAPTTP